MMKKMHITLLCLLLATMLGGCAGSTPDAFPRHYALTTPDTATAQSRSAPRYHQTLQVSHIRIPQWLHGQRMYYRPAYRGDGDIAAYVQSRWIDSPARLLANLVQHTIRAAGTWQAVIGPAATARADVSIHLVLHDFSQHFRQPDQSVGVLSVTATLIDDHDDSVIGQTSFHLHQPAPTANARGGVQALSRASQAFAAQLEQWIDQRMQR